MGESVKIVIQLRPCHLITHTLTKLLIENIVSEFDDQLLITMVWKYASGILADNLRFRFWSWSLMWLCHIVVHEIYVNNPIYQCIINHGMDLICSEYFWYHTNLFNT